MYRGHGQVILRGTLCTVLAVVVVLVFAGGALALSGVALKVAEPVRFKSPSVAVDSAGTAYIAWANETALHEEGEKIEYCVLPPGASACAHHGTLVVEGAKAPAISAVRVLVDETTVVLLAEVYGVSEEYGPVQEWTVPVGGEAFSPVDAGKSVANPVVDADSALLAAVVVPGPDTLGVADVTADGGPTFDGFSFAAPPQCSFKTCPAFEHQATLETEPERGLHPLRNLGGAMASRTGTNPGVLGVYETLGKPGCASGTNDTAFVYGSGEQSTANNYDVSPGEAQSAWRKALSPGDCEVQYPAVGGGPSGLGVVEKDDTRGYEVYHQFNQTTESFEAGTVTIAKEGGLDPSVSQDGSGGMYVTFLGNANDAIDFAYSATTGTSWTGPVVLNPNSDTGAHELVSAVGTHGQGWAVWHDGESVFAQQFDAADATPPAPPPLPPPMPASTFVIPKQTDDVARSGSFLLDIECKNAPCTGTLTLVAKVKKTTGKGKKKKTKTVVETIATLPFSVLPPGAYPVAVKLNAMGLSLLAHDHYKVNASASATYLSGGAYAVATGEVTLKGHKPKKKKKKKK